MNLSLSKKFKKNTRAKNKSGKRRNISKTKKKIKSFIQKGGTLSEDIQTNIDVRKKFFYPEIPAGETGLDEYQKIIEKYNPAITRRAATGMAIVPAEEGDIYEQINRNLQKINTEIETETSVISYVDLRGIVMKDNFQIVPPNTLICFVSPLDNSVSPNFNRDSSLLYSIINLNRKQYQNLFRFRTSMRYSTFNTAKMPGKELPIVYSNCLANSYWVSPGQLYPDMKFMLNTRAYRTDPDTEKCLYITLPFEGDRVNRPEQNRDAVSVEQLQQANVRDIRLSHIVRCDSRTEHLRLIMVVSSRGLEHRNDYTQDALNTIMKLELLNFEINKKIEDLLFEKKDVLHQIYFEENPIRATCGYVDSELERLIFFDANSISSLVSKTYNLNYHTMVPKLQDIYNDIDYVMATTNVKAVSHMYISFCSQSDAFFISGLSPKLILQFLGKVLGEKKIERRRLYSFFREISDGLALSMMKIIQYIQKSAHLLVFIGESNIQQDLFEVCLSICNFLTENKIILKETFSYKLEETVKLFKKSKGFTELIKSSLKAGKTSPYLICENNAELREIPKETITDDVTLEIKISGGFVPTVQGITKLKKLVFHSAERQQDLNLVDVHKLENLESLFLLNFNLNSSIILNELYPNLKSLTISRCQITKGTLESIIKLEHLEELNLEKINLFESPRIDLLDNLNNLKQLKLADLGDNMHMIHIKNTNLEIIVLQRIKHFILEPNLQLKCLQIEELDFSADLSGFPCHIPAKIETLALINCHNIAKENLLKPELFEFKNLILESNSIQLNMLTNILEKCKLQVFRAQNNQLLIDSEPSTGVVGEAVTIHPNVLTFLGKFSLQHKLKKLFLVNNTFPENSRLAEAILPHHKYESLIIKNNINLDLDLDIRRIKVKGKKIVEK